MYQSGATLLTPRPAGSQVTRGRPLHGDPRAMTYMAGVVGKTTIGNTNLAANWVFRASSVTKPCSYLILQMRVTITGNIFAF